MARLRAGTPARSVTSRCDLRGHGGRPGRRSGTRGRGVRDAYASGDSETDLGFFLVKGPEERVREILDTEEYRILLTTGNYVVEHQTREWLIMAEEVMTQIERSAKVATEFATVP